MKEKKQKFNFKQFVKDYAVEIGYVAGTVVLLGLDGGWLWHVKRNTTELFKFDIPEGKCYQHYRQFGKTYLNGEASMNAAPVFIQGLLDAGSFAASDRVLFMITDDKNI